MRKLIILFTLIVTGCATSGGSTPTSFEFYKNADHDGDKLIANTFYSVYGIYHTLGEVNLHNLFPVGDVNRMVLKIVKSLEQGEAIQMQVPNMTGKRTLIVTFRTDFETDTDLPSVFITTNYNQDKEKAVPLTKSQLKKAYVTLYYMVGDKLIPFWYIEDPYTEQELKEKDVLGRTYHYLFDKDFENDSQGMKLLRKAITQEKKRKEKVYEMIMLSYYQMMFGDYKAARQTLDDASVLTNKETNQQDRSNMFYNLRHAENIYNLCQEYEELLVR